MEKFEKFFSFNEDEGKVVLHPVNMGSDSWSLRSGDGNLLFSLEQFQDFGSVLLEDGEYRLNLIELDDYTAFSIRFNIKGRQIVVEDTICRNAYKRHYYSIMPDRGIYNLEKENREMEDIFEELLKYYC
jgi:hypothetical protein